MASAPPPGPDGTQGVVNRPRLQRTPPPVAGAVAGRPPLPPAAVAPVLARPAAAPSAPPDGMGGNRLRRTPPPPAPAPPAQRPLALGVGAAPWPSALPPPSIYAQPHYGAPAAPGGPPPPSRPPAMPAGLPPGPVYAYSPGGPAGPPPGPVYVYAPPPAAYGPAPVPKSAWGPLPPPPADSAPPAVAPERAPAALAAGKPPPPRPALPLGGALLHISEENAADNAGRGLPAHGEGGPNWRYRDVHRGREAIPTALVEPGMMDHPDEGPPLWTKNVWGMPAPGPAGTPALASGRHGTAGRQTKHAQATVPAAPPGVMAALARLPALQQTMRAHLSAMANFNEGERALLLRTCREVDVVLPRGLLTPREFQAVWARLGVSLTRDDARAFFLRFGQDREGRLPYEVFATVITERPARLLALEPLQEGAYLAGRDGSFRGQIKYPKSRTSVFTPSTWDGSLARRSGKLPEAGLRLEWVHGYDGVFNTDTNVYYTAKGQMVYYSAAVGIVLTKAHGDRRPRQRFFQGHDNDIRCLALHPGGRLVATGQMAGTGAQSSAPYLCVWDTDALLAEQPEAALVKRIEFPAESNISMRMVCVLAFSPGMGAKLLAITGDNHHTIYVFDWEMGPKKQAYGELCRMEGRNGTPPQVFGAVWNPYPEGKESLQFATYGTKHVKLWTYVADPKLPSRFGTYSAQQGTFGRAEMCDILSAEFLPSRRLLTGTRHGQLYIWEATGEFRCARAITAHGPGMVSIDPADGLPKLQGVRCLRRRPGGKRVLSGGGDGKVKEWDVAALEGGSSGDPAEVGSISLSSPGDSPDNPPCVRALDCAHEGGAFLAGTSLCDVWESASATALAIVIHGHDADAYGLAFHPLYPHQYVTCCESPGGSLAVWDATKRMLLKKVGVGAQCHSVAFSPTGSHLAVGTVTGAVMVLNDTLKRLRGANGAVVENKSFAEEVDDLKYSPDGTRLAAASHDNTIEVYDATKDYARLLRLRGHSSYVTHLDWSADGRWLQSNCGAYEHLYFDALTGKSTKMPMRDEVWHTYTCILGFPVMGIWAPDSDGTDVNAACRTHNRTPGSPQYVVTADDYGFVTLFNYPCVVEHAPGRAVIGHSSHVMNVRFSPDDKRVVSVGGHDRAVMQWLVDPVARVVVKPPPNVVDGAVFSNPMGDRNYREADDPTTGGFVPYVLSSALPPKAAQPYSAWNDIGKQGPPSAAPAGILAAAAGYAPGTRPIVAGPVGAAGLPVPSGTLAAGGGPGTGPIAQYKVIVTTSDIKGASTDARVYITVVGGGGTLPRKTLDGNPGDFERGKTDVFPFACPDLGELSQVTIGTNGAGERPGWHCQEVRVQSVSHGREWRFPCNQWLDADQGDHKLERTLLEASSPAALAAARAVAASAGEKPPLLKYKVTTVTSDIKGAGTDAHVTVDLYGAWGGKPTHGGPFGLETSKNNFERGCVDSFFLEAAVGPVGRVDIRHDNTGSGPAWHLASLILEWDETAGHHTRVVFPCGRWLSKTDDDGQIQRTLLPEGTAGAGGPSRTCTYKVVVATSDIKGAATSATVFANLIGEAGESGARPLESSSHNFGRGKEDVFYIECPDLGALKLLRLGHDNKGLAPAWHCDMVTVYNQTLPPPPPSGKGLLFGPDHAAGATTAATATLPPPGGAVVATATVPAASAVPGPSVSAAAAGHAPRWDFVVGQWFDSTHGDKLIVRDIPVTNLATAERVTYTIRTTTSDIKGAGTDANVTIVLYGGEDDKNLVASEVLKLEASHDCFERGKEDKFVCPAKNVGRLRKVYIGIDGKSLNLFKNNWHLHHVEVEVPGDQDSPYYFPCENWLGSCADDKQLSRFLDVAKVDPEAEKGTYNIALQTSDIKFAGTDANVFIILYGDKGDSGKLELVNYSRNNFERNQRDEFNVKCKNVGTLSRVHLGHDNSGVGPGWHLAEVQVESIHTKQHFTFPCHAWLDKTVGPQFSAERDLFLGVDGADADALLVPYQVKVHTSDKRLAGTDANVHLKLVGKDGATAPLPLTNTSKNLFERGQTDDFELKAPELGPLTSCVVGHDNTGVGPGWHLASVSVRNMKTGDFAYFPCDQWLDSTEGDRKTERELVRVDAASATKWKVTTVTGDVKFAGTDANVVCSLIGTTGTSGPHKLENRGKNLFERGQADEFEVDVGAAALGELTEVEVEHDGAGLGSEWYLQEVVVHNLASGAQWNFPAARWLDKAKGTAKVRLQLPDKNAALRTYKVTTVTSDIRFAGTDANVTLQIFGTKADSGKRPLANHQNDFERGHRDVFYLKDVPDLGELKYIVISHDSTGFGPGWHLAKVEIEDSNAPPPVTAIEFPCNKWLDKSVDPNSTTQQLLPLGADAAAAGMQKYTVTIHTSDIRFAGTDAGVEIELFGEAGKKIGPWPLESSKDNFQRNTRDVFTVPGPAIGKLSELVLRHDNKGVGAAWHVEQVTVRDEATGADVFFPCNQWIEKHAGVAHAQVTLKPGGAGAGPGSHCKYIVSVFTSDIRYAGTDAVVTMVLYGLKGDTGKRELANSRNNFERNQEDTFFFEAPDIGDMTKLKIGHDNSGIGGAWHLKEVVCKNEVTGANATFACNRWLDTKEGLEVELVPEGEGAAKAALASTYNVVVHTGSDRGAGTSANVSIELNGDKGSVGSTKLEKGRGDFDRGAVTSFVVTGTDVGTLTSIAIGHDGHGMYSAWQLKEVEVENVTTRGAKAIFFCNEWLDAPSAKNPLGRSRTLYAAGTLEALMAAAAKPRVYKVTTKTSAERFAATDGNVHVTLVGAPPAGGGPAPAVSHELTNPAIRDLFEWNQANEFYIEGPPIGPLQRIEVELKPGMAVAWKRAWHLEWVSIQDVVENVEYRFACGEWFKGPAELHKSWDRATGPKGLRLDDGTFRAAAAAARAPGAATKYLVTTYTSDMPKAGTNNNVQVRLWGTAPGAAGAAVETHAEHVLERAMLTDKSGRDLFERKMADEFELSCTYLGELTKVSLVLQPYWAAGTKHDWHLDMLVIEDTVTKKQWRFRCGAWFKAGSMEKTWSLADGAHGLALIQPETAVAEAGRDESTGGAGPSTAPAAPPVRPLPPRPTAQEFKVVVVTAKDGGASNSNMILTLVGTDPTKALSQELTRHKGSHWDLFELGQTDEFTLAGPYLGSPLQAVKLALRPGVIKRHWQMASLTIHDSSLGPAAAPYVFRGVGDGWFKVPDNTMERGWERTKGDQPRGLTLVSEPAMAPQEAGPSMVPQVVPPTTGVAPPPPLSRQPPAAIALPPQPLGAIPPPPAMAATATPSTLPPASRAAPPSVLPPPPLAAPPPVSAPAAPPPPPRPLMAKPPPRQNATADYRLVVFTGAKGTAARVFAQLIGEQGTSRELPLVAPPPSTSSPHDRRRPGPTAAHAATEYLFLQEPEVGELISLRIWHDGAPGGCGGAGASWTLEQVEVQNLTAPVTRWLLPCGDTLEAATKANPRGPERVLHPPRSAAGAVADTAAFKPPGSAQFRITVHTADEDDADASGQVFLLLTGLGTSRGGKPTQAGVELERSRLRRGTIAHAFVESPGWPGWPDEAASSVSAASAMGDLANVTLVIKQGLSAVGTWRPDVMLILDAASGREYRFSIPDWFGASSLVKTWDVKAAAGAGGLVLVTA